MGRKVLQQIGNTPPRMVIGRCAYHDLEKFADLPTTRITIDVLRQVAIRDGFEPLSPQIVEELGNWLTNRMAAENVPREAVSEVTLQLDVRSDCIATDRKRIVLFDFECLCRISTPDRTYEGGLKEHRWHQRVGV